MNTEKHSVKIKVESNKEAERGGVCGYNHEAPVVRNAEVKRIFALVTLAVVVASRESYQHVTPSLTHLKISQS